MASVYHAVTDRWALMGNVGWQNWEEFGQVGITVESEQSRSATVDAGFQDTWHMALGTQYRLAPLWLLSAGFAYDSSPVSKFHRTPSMPLDRNFRYGVGLQYDWSEAVTIGAAYEFLDAGSAEIAGLKRPAGTLQGDYSTNHMQFIALNMIWKFYKDEPSLVNLNHNLNHSTLFLNRGHTYCISRIVATAVSEV